MKKGSRKRTGQRKRMIILRETSSDFHAAMDYLQYRFLSAKADEDEHRSSFRVERRKTEAVQQRRTRKRERYNRYTQRNFPLENVYLSLIMSSENYEETIPK